MRLPRIPSLFLMVALASVACGADDASSVLAFGDHLFERGDYYRAITEYERFLFLTPTNPAGAHARFQIGMCYYRGEKWTAARDYLNDLKEHTTDPRVWRLLGETYYRLGQYAKAESTLGEFMKRFPEAPDVDEVRLLHGLCLLRFGNADWAREAWLSTPTSSPQRASAEVLARDAHEYGRVPLKSPGVAGTLSALLPGAGQLYVDRPRDALVSFLLNGATVAGALAAFNNDEEVAGALLCLLELSWYSGNINNAVTGAHTTNTRRRERLLQRYELQCGWVASPGASPGPAVGVRLRF